MSRRWWSWDAERAAGGVCLFINLFSAFACEWLIYYGAIGLCGDSSGSAVCVWNDRLAGRDWIRDRRELCSLRWWYGILIGALLVLEATQDGEFRG